jgi:hypothetical protein
LAPTLPFLEELMMPASLQTNEHEGKDDVKRSISRTTEIVQTVISSILHRNEPLAEKVSSTLVDHFTSLANASIDILDCPELNFFFIVCLPEGRPLKRVQDLIVASIMRQTNVHFLEGLKCCLRVAVETFNSHSDVAESSKGDDGKTGVSPDKRKKSSNESPQLRNPARLLRLMRCLVEGGNESAWQSLTKVSGISLERGLESMVRIVNYAGLGENNPVNPENEATHARAVSEPQLYNVPRF